MGRVEWERIVDYLGYEPRGDPKTWVCPMLDGNNCTVHPVRPLICRLWGATEDMRCKHGCKPEYYLTRAQAEELIHKVYAIKGISYKLWGKENYDRERGIVKLSVKERLVLGGLLPPEGDLTTLRNIQKIKAVISFSDEEVVRWNIKVEGDRATWDMHDKEGKPIEQDIEIEFKPNQIAIIAAELERRSKNKTLILDHLALCEKFGVE